MQAALEGFRASAARVRHLDGLHSAIASLTTTALDPSDLLRAQIVLTVSALDYFIHEITVYGLLETFQNLRPATEAFNKQKISGYLVLGNAIGSASHFEEDVRLRHSILSFQQPDKIADAVRLFYKKPIWKEVSLRIGQPEAQVKTQLRLIVERRNKIAHEADIDPSFPGARWPITSTDTTSALEFVEEICESIFLITKL